MAVACFILSQVLVAITNRRVMLLVSGRPFAPKISVSQSDHDDGEKRATDFDAVGIAVMLLGGLTLLAYLAGGSEGLMTMLTLVIMLFVAPVAATMSTMVMFNLLDCVSDLTRMSAKAVGMGTFFASLAIICL